MKDAVMFSCDVCRRGFQHGPDRYEGRSIPAYKMLVCESCWQGNWEGWTPAREPQVLEHIAKNDIPIPSRNAKGWIPRGD
jgi:hypothetical protein